MNKQSLLLFLGISLCFNSLAQPFVGQSGIGLPGNKENNVMSAVDYNSDGALDIAIGNTLYINNGNNSFSLQAGITFPDFSTGTAVWADYDSDGYPDLLITGWFYNKRVSKLYHNNGNRTFSDAGISLVGVSASSAAWCDFNNDGHPDFLLTGYNTSASKAVTLLYQNTGSGSFILRSDIVMPGIENGAVAFGNYDNDGFEDVLITGYSNGSYISKVFRNNNGSGFSEETEIVLPGVVDGSAAWGDYDNDGVADLLLTGYSASGPITKLYHNKGNNTFAENTSVTLPGVMYSSVEWADYDNDGYLDIALAGSVGDSAITILYHNESGSSFTKQTSIILPGVEYGSIAWADYDNDGDNDLLLSGGSEKGTKSICQVFQNKLINGTAKISNAAASAPSNLKAITNRTSVTFKWDKASDTETPQNGLSYNLYIYKPGKSDYIISPMANKTTGQQLIAKYGNIQWSPTGYTLQDTLEKGQTYKYSIQAIDVGLKGGVFATEDSFIANKSLVLDSLALVSLYNKTNGPAWTNQANWLTGPVKDWYGVTVDNKEVVALALDSNNLKGPVPVELARLAGIRRISLRNNALDGTMPDSMGVLRKLSYLDLGRNQVYGKIPTKLVTRTNTPIKLDSNAYTFNSLLAALQSKSSTCQLSYTPQAAFFLSNNIALHEGLNSQLSVAIDNDISSNAYRWQLNGINIPGASSRNLDITNVAAKDTGLYVCFVTNPGVPGLEIKSKSMRLTVLAPEIVTQPSTTPVCSGNNAEIKITVLPTTAQFRWQIYNGTEWKNIVNGIAYSGANNSTLTVINPKLSLNGAIYHCIIKNTVGEITSGNVILPVDSIRFNPLKDTLVVKEDSTANFGCTATAAYPLQYQWQYKTVSNSWSDIGENTVYTGTNTAKLTITKVDVAIDKLVIRSKISNGYCDVYTNTTVIDVKTLHITANPENIAVCENSPATFTIASNGSPVMYYQWQVNDGNGWADVTNNSNYIGAATSTLQIINCSYLMNKYRYRCTVKNYVGQLLSGEAVLTVEKINWLSQPASNIACNGKEINTTCSASSDSYTNYKWMLKKESGSWAELSDNSNINGSSTSQLVINNIDLTYNNSVIKCKVNSSVCESISDNAVFTVKDVQVISNPVNAEICEGQDTAFSISATSNGTGSLSYQWYSFRYGYSNILNENSFSENVTSARVKLNNVPGPYSGTSFYCKVSNGACSANTSMASLNMPLYFSKQPADTQLCVLSDAKIWLTAASNIAISYQWQLLKNNTWTGITACDSITGESTPIIILRNLNESHNGTKLRCIATTSFCSITSRTVTISVSPYPEKPIIANNKNTLLSGSIADTYHWYLDNNLLPLQNSGSFYYTQTGNYKLNVTTSGCTSAFSEELHLEATSLANAYGVSLQLDSIYLSQNFTLSGDNKLRLVHGIFNGSYTSNAGYNEWDISTPKNLTGIIRNTGVGNIINIITLNDNFTFRSRLDQLPDTTALLGYNTKKIYLGGYWPNQSHIIAINQNFYAANDTMWYTMKYILPGFPASSTLELQGDNNGIICEGMDLTLSLPTWPMFNYKLIWEYAWDADKSNNWSMIDPQNIYQIEATEGVTLSNFIAPRPPIDGMSIMFRVRFQNGGIFYTLPSKKYICYQSKGFTVRVQSEPKHSLHPYNVTCYGGNNGQMQIQASGGEREYTFDVKANIFDYLDLDPDRDYLNYDSTGMLNLTDGQGISKYKEIRNMMAGDYTWKVTDNRGCFFTKTITLTQPSKINYTIEKTNIEKCYGDATGSLQINMTDAGNYEFSIGKLYKNTTGLFESLKAGKYNGIILKTYYKVQSDSLFCLKTFSETIETPPALYFEPDDIVVSQNQRCYGSPIQFDLSASGGTGVLTSLIDGNISNTGNIISNIKPGDHSITITDTKGCCVKDSFHLEENQEPLGFSYLNAKPAALCDSKDGSLEFSFSGAHGRYNTILNNDKGEVGHSTGDATYAGLSSGKYNLIITDVINCKITKGIFIGSEDTALSGVKSIMKFKNLSNSGSCDSIFSMYGESPDLLDPRIADLKVRADFFGFYSLDMTYREAIACFIKDSFPTGITWSFNQSFLDTVLRKYPYNLRIFRFDSMKEYPVKKIKETFKVKFIVDSLPADIYIFEYSVEGSSCKKIDTVYLSQEFNNWPGYTVVQPTCYGYANGKIVPDADYKEFRLLDLDLDIAKKQYTNQPKSSHMVKMVTDNGCVKYEKVIIDEPAQIDIGNKTINNILCYGYKTGSIAFNPSGGTGTLRSYITGPDNISTFLPSPLASDLIAGNYIIKIEDDNNCSMSFNNIFISQPSAIYIVVDSDSVANISCSELPVGKFELNTYGGIVPYAYYLDADDYRYWTDDPHFKNLPANQYIYQVKDNNGCVLQDTFEILKLQSLTLTSKTQKSLCDVYKGAVRVKAKDGIPPYTYYWPDTTLETHYTDTLSNLKAGVYKVIVSDAKNCTDSFNIKIADVDPPRLMIPKAIGPSCFDYNDGSILMYAKGGFSPYTFTIGEDIYKKPDTSDLVIRNLKSGNYQIKLADVYGCDTIKTVKLQNKELLQIKYDTIIAPSCSAEPIGSFKGRGKGGTMPYLYSVDSDINLLELDKKDLGNGTYIVQVIDNNNCNSLDTIVFNAPATISSGLQHLYRLCPGQEIKIDAGNKGAKYSWSSESGNFSDDSSIVKLKDEDTYYLNIKYSDICQANEVFQINLSDTILKANIILADTIYENDTLVVFELSEPIPDALNWSFPGLSEASGSTNTRKLLVANSPGNYLITLDAILAGCNDTYSSSVEVLPESMRPSPLQGMNPEFTLDVYPVPSDGLVNLHLKFENPQNGVIRLVDEQGKIISTKYIKNITENTILIDLSNNQNGLYYISVSAGNMHQGKVISIY
jgi:hypothetical protein